MGPKLLATSDTTPPDAARPQLKLAARATEDARDLPDATSAAISDEVQRAHAAWRQTLEAVKAAIAGLERSCESAIEAHQGSAADLVDKLVAGARAGADEAAREARAEAQIEIAGLQGELAALKNAIDGLKEDLELERDRVKAISAQLDLEVAGRVRAESERDEARRVSQQAASAAESQARELRAESDARRAELALARQQLDAARAERSRLIATFDSVQRVLSLGQSVDGPDAQEAGRDLVRPEDGAPKDASPQNSIESAPSVAGPAAGPSDAPGPDVEPNPEVIDDVRRVLEQVEAMYSADVNAGRSPMDVVDSLTASLRYARDVIVARWEPGDCDAEAAFDQQIAVLLELKAGTTYARHLSIAAYASRRPSPPHRGEAGPAQPSVAGA